MTAKVDLFGQPAGDRLTTKQLPLPLGWRAHEAAEPTLLGSDAHMALIGALVDWRHWATSVATLTGPPRSGKSLLAGHVADQVSGMRVIDPAKAHDETSLFHLCNAALAEDWPLLLVGEPDWRPTLPDLATRIAAAQDFVMPDPDAELVGALLQKGMAERHLIMTPEIAMYLAHRLERSYEVVEGAIATLVSASRDQRRPLTLPFSRQVLAEAGLFSPDIGAGSAAA